MIQAKFLGAFFVSFALNLIFSGGDYLSAEILLRFQFTNHESNGWSDTSWFRTIEIHDDGKVYRCGKVCGDRETYEMWDDVIVWERRSPEDTSPTTFDELRKVVTEISIAIHKKELKSIQVFGRPVLRGQNSRQIRLEIVSQDGSMAPVYLLMNDLSAHREIIQIVDDLYRLNRILGILKSILPRDVHIPSVHSKSESLRFDPITGLGSAHFSPEVLVLDSNTPHAKLIETEGAGLHLGIPVFYGSNYILVRTPETPKRVSLYRPDQSYGTNLLLEWPLADEAMAMMLVGAVGNHFNRSLVPFTSGSGLFKVEVARSDKSWPAEFQKFPCVRLLGWMGN